MIQGRIKMKQKRLLAVLLAAVMLTSCSLGDSSESRKKKKSSDSSSSSQSESSSEKDSSSDESTPDDDSSKEEQEYTDDYTELCKGLVSDMVQGDFKSTADLFTDEVKAKLDEDKLIQYWAQLEGAAGKYKETLFAQSQLAGDGVTTVIVYTQFENMKIDVKFGVNGNGELVGMFFTEAGDGVEPEETDKYAEEKITIGSLGLNGMLTVPKNVYKPPVVVLVQGSGQNDMNEGSTFYGLAHGLAERGVAVIRYNKRFFQFPELEDENVTVKEEVLDDADAAIALARQYVNEGKASGIVLLGHSLGGLLAPSIAANNTDINAMISLAGTPRDITDVFVDQIKPQIEASSGEQKKLLEQLLEQLETYKNGGWVDNTNPLPFRLEFKKAYWDSLTSVRPDEIAKGLTMPMLFLQGSNDTRVYADKDYVQWQESLADKPNCYFKLYEGLGHFFDDKTGSFDAEVMDDIAGFVKAV